MMVSLSKYISKATLGLIVQGAWVITSYKIAVIVVWNT